MTDLVSESSSSRTKRPTRRRPIAKGRAPLRLPRVPGLDGLRLLGALAVVVYHTMGAVLGANPSAGVILPPFAFAFFIISGFVIYRPFATAHLNRQKMPSTRKYLTGRALRVLPLWWVALGVYLLVNGTGGLDTPLEWVATFGLLQFAIPEIRFAVIGPAWALSVEWIFYLTAPFLASGLRTANRRFLPRTDPFKVQLAVLLPLAVVTAVIAPVRPFVAIIVGMLLAVTDVRRHLTKTTPQWLEALRAPGLALVVTAVAWVILIDYPYKPGLSVQWVEQDPLVVLIWLAVAACWFATVAFREPEGIITKRLDSPVAVRLALLSFGLYLWHDLVLQQTIEHLGIDAHLGAALYLTLVGSFTIATLTFFTIERPLMMIRARIVPPPPLPKKVVRAAAAEALDEEPGATPAEVAAARAVVATTPSVEPRPAAVAAEVEHERLERLPADQRPDRASSPGRGWITSIDGLRVIAALCVITFHVCAEQRVPMAWATGMAALFIPAWSSFFVVSGYVLYRPWAMAHARMALGDGIGPSKAPDGGIGTFWLRRILRVYPVYWVVQGVAMAISGTGDVHGLTDWFQIITLFPLPNFDVIIHHGLGVIVWTMVVELAYYTVLPFISRGITLLIKQGAGYAVAQAVPLGILFGACVYLGSTSARVLCVAACIVVGMGIAAIDGWQRTLRRWVPGVRVLSRNPIIILPVLVAAWAIGSWVAKDDDPEFLFRSYLPVHLGAMVIVSTVMFLPAVFGPANGGYRRFLSSTPMRVLGPLTFGIYLWHYPIIRWTTERIDLPLAALWIWVVVSAPVLALGTYRLVEEPMEKVRHRYFGRTSAAAPSPAPERSHA